MEWAVDGLTHFLMEPFATVDSIPAAVYTVEWNESHGRLELKLTQKKFEFPYKIYDLDRGFIQRVTKTYEHTSKNLGVLLHGIKGTGKTVTTKMICNELNLPVLIVHRAWDGLSTFINKIPQDVIILIDEFEKVYKDKSEKMLSLMDGVFDSGRRRVFLLTSNSLEINKNLLNRPGRIRYAKEYKDMSREAIEEIVDDLLVHKRFRQEIIDTISFLEIITIDVIKAVISEVNIHETSPAKLMDDMNVHKTKPYYDVFRIEEKDGDTVEKLLAKKKYIWELDNSPKGFGEEHEEDDLYINGKGYTVAEIHEPYEITCRSYRNGEEVLTRMKFRGVPKKHKMFRF